MGVSPLFETHPSCLSNKWERLEAVKLISWILEGHDVVGVYIIYSEVISWDAHEVINFFCILSITVFTRNYYRKQTRLYIINNIVFLLQYLKKLLEKKRKRLYIINNKKKLQDTK